MANKVNKPIIFNIATTLEGRYAIYTSDERFKRRYCFEGVRTDNLYIAIDAITQEYKDEYEIVFKVTREVL
jgi:hypothetical protein